MKSALALLFAVALLVVSFLLAAVMTTSNDGTTVRVPGHLLVVPTTLDAAARYEQQFVQTGTYGARFLHCDDLPEWVQFVDTSLDQQHMPILCYVQAE